MIIKQCLIKTYVLPPPSPHLIIDNKLNWSVQESDTFYHKMPARFRQFNNFSQTSSTKYTLDLLSACVPCTLFSLGGACHRPDQWPHLCSSQFRLDTSGTWTGNYWLVPDSGRLLDCAKQKGLSGNNPIDWDELTNEIKLQPHRLSTSPGYLCIVPHGPGPEVVWG